MGAPTLREIGIGLGRQPRFCGQTREWYPVLAHSLVVAALTAPKWRPQALLHDAHESVLGDTVTTWKTPERHKHEDRLQARIYERLGLAWPNEEGAAAIKAADLAALAAEAHILGHPEAEHYWPIETVSYHARALTTLELLTCRAYLDAPVAADALDRAFSLALQARDADRLATHA